MLHYALYGLHLFEWYRLCCPLEIKEVTYEDRLFFLIYYRGPFLKFLVTAQSGGKLQRGYCVRVPCMLYAVFAPSKQSVVL